MNAGFADQRLAGVYLRLISDLPRSRRLQSEPASRGLEFVWRDRSLFLQSESLIFVQQSLALGAQVFVLIPVLNGGEVLFSGKNKSAGEYEATEQQQSESRQRGRISSATNLCVELMFRKPFHKRHPQISQITQR